MTEEQKRKYKAELELKRLELQLEEWDKKSTFEKIFPELSGIPVIWLVIGGIALLINLFSLII